MTLAKHSPYYIVLAAVPMPVDFMSGPHVIQQCPHACDDHCPTECMWKRVVRWSCCCGMVEWPWIQPVVN